MSINPETLKRTLLRYQKAEITEHFIYHKLAAAEKSETNRKVLEDIAGDELRHYHVWEHYTKLEVKPGILKIFFYYVISKILGLTFGVKLMERGEGAAQINYTHLQEQVPEARQIAEEENEHEKTLLNLLDEERLQYAGSMVLGLNDALVELTGALAGFTFALHTTKLIALTGAITGFAAALSMSASGYLSTKAEMTKKNPLKAAAYTGVAYVITVVILILPYLLLSNHYHCLACTLTSAIILIAAFNYYLSVAKEESFRIRFLEMAGISLGVAALSFLIGCLLRTFIGVDV
jgi:VIT1/CCC1 family predicted Fe2+/Mn2+ transporter